MRKNKLRTIVLGGAIMLTALALPAAYAQTAPGPETPTPSTAPAPPPSTMPPASPAEPPEESSSDRFRIGPEIGVYFPTNSKTRDRFGDAWPAIGIGIGPFRPATTRGELAASLNFFYQQRHGNHIFLAPIGLSYRVALGEGPGAIPYAGVTPALYLADIRSEQDNVSSGLNATGGVSVFTGLTFGENTNLEVRYEAVSKIKGFNLSGFVLSAGYRF